MRVLASLSAYARYTCISSFPSDVTPWDFAAVAETARNAGDTFAAPVPVRRAFSGINSRCLRMRVFAQRRTIAARSLLGSRARLSVLPRICVSLRIRDAGRGARVLRARGLSRLAPGTMGNEIQRKRRFAFVNLSRATGCLCAAQPRMSENRLVPALAPLAKENLPNCTDG